MPNISFGYSIGRYTTGASINATVIVHLNGLLSLGYNYLEMTRSTSSSNSCIFRVYENSSSYIDYSASALVSIIGKLYFTMGSMYDQDSCYYTVTFSENNL